MSLERDVAGLRCGQVLERLSEYLDGDVDPATRAGIEAHVRGCDWCEQFGGRFSSVVYGLRRSLAAPEIADAGVADRLAAFLARER